MDSFVLWLPLPLQFLSYVSVTWENVIAIYGYVYSETKAHVNDESALQTNDFNSALHGILQFSLTEFYEGS